MSWHTHSWVPRQLVSPLLLCIQDVEVDTVVIVLYIVVVATAKSHSRTADTLNIYRYPHDTIQCGSTQWLCHWIFKVGSCATVERCTLQPVHEYYTQVWNCHEYRTNWTNTLSHTLLACIHACTQKRLLSYYHNVCEVCLGCWCWWCVVAERGGQDRRMTPAHFTDIILHIIYDPVRLPMLLHALHLFHCCRCECRRCCCCCRA